MSLFILAYSVVSYADCSLDYRAGISAFEKADEYVAYTEQRVIAMKNSRRGSVAYCAKAKEAGSGLLAAANSFKKSYELLSDVAGSCGSPQYSKSFKYSQMALEGHEEHVNVLRDMDKILVRDCDESPVSGLLD